MKLSQYYKKKCLEAKENNLEEEGVKFLLTNYFYKSYTSFIMSLNDEINEEEYDKTINLYVQNKIPVQYILGYTIFYSRVFYVDKNVLIPRYDTQLLCEKAIELIEKENITSVIDIGTGSGIIPVTIYHNISKQISIDAIDISIEALNVAKKNAEGTNINLFQSDLFSNVTNKYDLIISNPPYIKTDAQIDSYVKDNEPNIALFGGLTGLDYYIKIINESDKYLNSNGHILFEIGHDQGCSVKQIILNKYPKSKVTVYKDYNNNDRVVYVRIGE